MTSQLPAGSGTFLQRVRLGGISSIVAGVIAAAFAFSVHGTEYPDPPFEFADVPFPGRPLLNPDDGIRRLDTLVVFIQLDGFVYSGMTAGGLADQIFGFTGNSAARFLLAGSNGSAFLQPAIETEASLDGAANDGVVIVDGGDSAARNLTGEEWRRLGIDLADPYIDYSAYDDDGDGRIDQRELSLLVIVGDGRDGGQDGPIDDSGRELDGVNFRGRTVAIVGDRTTDHTVIHEFMHQAYDHIDLYCVGIGDWDIMGGDKGVSAFTKLKLGWANPIVVSQDGWYTLRRADRFEDMLLLYDPDHGTNEYYLVENRVPDGIGLYGAPDSGLYIQRVNSDFWGSRHSSEPPAETIRPDGMLLTPGCTEFSFLASEARAGSGSLVVENGGYFDAIARPFDVILKRASESDREEIVTVTDISGDTLLLDGPLALDHGTGTEVKWTRLGFGKYFATELRSDADAGDSTVLVKRVAGNVPMLPFEASLGGVKVTVDEVTPAYFGLSEPLGRDFDAGTRLASLWDIARTVASGDDAWDTADPATMDFDEFNAFFGDADDPRVNVFAIGPAAETTEVFIDVPADEASWFLARPGVHTFSRSSSREATLPWQVANAGSAGDSLHMDIADRDGTSWGTADISLARGTSGDLDPVLRAPSAFDPPDGLELLYDARSLADPTVTYAGNILVDFPFPEYSDSAFISSWSATPPDQRVFALAGTGSGIVYSTAADFDGNVFTSAPQMTISPLTDTDMFNVTLPDLTLQLLPLLDLPAGQPVPASIPDCGQLGSIEVPGPFGPETFEIRSMLEVEVHPRDNFRPPADDLRLFTNPITRPYLLRQTFDCPYLRVTDTNRDGSPSRRVRLQLSAGEARLQRYRYNLSANYRVQILRIPADSIFRDLADEDGRGIPCSGGFFPICMPDAFNRFETPLPAARLKPPGCPADGCPDHFTFSWQGGDALELVFLAPALTKIAVLDAFGNRLAEAFPDKPTDGFPVLTDGPAASAETVREAGLEEPLELLNLVAMNSLPPVLEDQPPPLPPSDFIADPLPADRVLYRLPMANVSSGLHFLQVQIREGYDLESDPAPIAVAWTPTDNDGDGVDFASDNCPNDFNPGQADFDADLVGDACDDDVDGDGVSNDVDACPSTPVGEAADPASGCSIAQYCPCSGPFGSTNPWINHGQFVSCVSKTAENFLTMGLVTATQKDAIVSEAAQSGCGK